MFFAQSAVAQKDSIPATKRMDSLSTGKTKPDVINQKDSVQGGRAKIGSKKAGKSKSKKQDSISIRDYKIISYQRDTTYLDTTLTIRKEYKYK